MANLTVTHLNHDLQNRKSYVNFVWSDDPTKRLGLEVPFSTTLENAQAEAVKAVQVLSAELAAASLKMPPVI